MSGKNQTVAVETAQENVETAVAVETPTTENVVETPNVAVASNTKSINSAECDKIVLIETETPYNKGKKAEKGKSFNTYSFNGIAFIVDSNLPFVEDQLKGNLHSVDFLTGERERTRVDENGVETTETVPTLSFVCSVSKTQIFNSQLHQVRLAQLTNLAKAPLNDAMLDFLMKGA